MPHDPWCNNVADYCADDQISAGSKGGRASSKLNKSKENSRNSGDNRADIRYKVEEECQKTPHDREIDTEYGEPDGYQHTGDQIEHGRDNHIAFDVDDESCNLRKNSLRLIGNGAKLDREAGRFEQNEHYRE